LNKEFKPQIQPEVGLVQSEIGKGLAEQGRKGGKILIFNLPPKVMEITS